MDSAAALAQGVITLFKLTVLALFVSVGIIALFRD